MQGTDFTNSGRRPAPRSTRAVAAWVLIAAFLMQPVLTYLVTPIVAHGAKGQQVVVCTLKGTRLVAVDLPQLAEPSDSEHCPALKLYQMAGTAQISQAPVPSPVSLYSVELLDQTADRQHRTLHSSAYSTRAPPLSS